MAGITPTGKPAGTTQQTLIYVDPETEALILAGFLQQDRELMSSGLLESIQPWMFSVDAYKWLVEHGLKGRSSPPAKATLTELITEKTSQTDQREVLLLSLHRLYDLELAWKEDAIAQFRRFITLQTASAGVRTFFESFQSTHNVDFALRDLQASIAEASALLEPQPVQIVDYAEDYARRVAERKHRRDNPDLYQKLRLGIAKFDTQIHMRPGTVTNFLAPLKRFKSVILASLAFAGVLQGFNVVLVVLENTLELTLDRIDAMATQISYDRITSHLLTSAERAYVDELFQRISSWPQRLKVVKGDPYKFGVPELERELKNLAAKDGFRPDVGVFDYLNIIKPSKGDPQDYKGQEVICWDLQRWAKAPGQNRIVVTATQANMEGVGTDKDGKPVRLQTHHQGKALAIAQAVDQTIAINIDPGKVEENIAQPPTIILSPLYIRNGVVIYPEVPLVSELDRLCIDREMRRLWDEADELPRPTPPGDLVTVPEFAVSQTG